jgi:hypothetical protein
MNDAEWKTFETVVRAVDGRWSPSMGVSYTHEQLDAAADAWQQQKSPEAMHFAIDAAHEQALSAHKRALDANLDAYAAAIAAEHGMGNPVSQ